jgi:hypothetical protein
VPTPVSVKVKVTEEPTAEGPRPPSGAVIVGGEIAVAAVAAEAADVVAVAAKAAARTVIVVRARAARPMGLLL